MAKQQADAVTDAKRRGPESNPGAPDFAGAALPWDAGRCGAVAVPTMSICCPAHQLNAEVSQRFPSYIARLDRLHGGEGCMTQAQNPTLRWRQLGIHVRFCPWSRVVIYTPDVILGLLGPHGLHRNPYF